VAVVVVAVLIVLTMVVFGLALPGTFRGAGPEQTEDRPEARTGVVAVNLSKPPPVGPDSDSERAEAMLARLLVSGTLPAGEYQRSMARLAAHDSVRHPLVVPPELTS
jgi:hypothetical protein